MASEGLDLLCFGLVAAGVEHLQWTPPKRTPGGAEAASSYPWSHGLLMSGIWLATSSPVTAAVRRSRKVGLGLEYSLEGGIH